MASVKSSELKEAFEQIGIPVAIISFHDERPLPHLVVLPTGEKTGGSDFGNELVSRDFSVELYTIKKDEELEERLEKLLDGLGIHWEKNETYIDEEAMYQVTYDFGFYERRK